MITFVSITLTSMLVHFSSSRNSLALGVEKASLVELTSLAIEFYGAFAYGDELQYV